MKITQFDPEEVLRGASPLSAKSIEPGPTVGSGLNSLRCHVIDIFLIVSSADGHGATAPLLVVHIVQLPGTVCQEL
jgi:hypothetical protein